LHGYNRVQRSSRLFSEIVIRVVYTPPRTCESDRSHNFLFEFRIIDVCCLECSSIIKYVNLEITIRTQPKQIKNVLSFTIYQASLTYLVGTSQCLSAY